MSVRNYWLTVRCQAGQSNSNDNWQMLHLANTETPSPLNPLGASPIAVRNAGRESKKVKEHRALSREN